MLFIKYVILWKIDIIEVRLSDCHIKGNFHTNCYLITDQSATYTNFISEELFSRVTRLSTLPGSGLKQGWSGFRVLPSSGMHVCSHVSKKGVSPEGLGSDRMTWKGEIQDSRVL